MQGLLTALAGFGEWLSQNFDTDQADEVSTTQLLQMQKNNQRVLLIVMGLSITAMAFTVFWSQEGPNL